MMIPHAGWVKTELQERPLYRRTIRGKNGRTRHCYVWPGPLDDSWVYSVTRHPMNGRGLVTIPADSVLSSGTVYGAGYLGTAQRAAEFLGAEM